METVVSEASHLKIEAEGKMRVTKRDGTVFYILPKGRLMIEDQWVHDVVMGDSLPIQ
jgi:hypothetical protein